MKESKHALYIVSSIFIFSTIYCLPFWFEYEYSNLNENIVRTSIGKNPLFNLLIHYAFYIVVVYLIPFTVLSLINTYLVIFLIKSKRKKDKLMLRTYSTFNNQHLPIHTKFTRSTSGSFIHDPEVDRAHKHRATTIMLTMIVFSFIACQFPNLVLHVLESKRWVENDYLKTIARLLIIFYLSFNFAYYACFNQICFDQFKRFFTKKTFFRVQLITKDDLNQTEIEFTN